MNGKISAVAHMNYEGHLTKAMKRVDGGKPHNQYADRTLPKNLDSCFGDFPPESRPKKTKLVADPSVLTYNEASIAVTAKCKYFADAFNQFLSRQTRHVSLGNYLDVLHLYE